MILDTAYIIKKEQLMLKHILQRCPKHCTKNSLQKRVDLLLHNSRLVIT